MFWTGRSEFAFENLGSLCFYGLIFLPHFHVSLFFQPRFYSQAHKPLHQSEQLPLQLDLRRLVKKSNIAQFHKCHNMLSKWTEREPHGNQNSQQLFSLISELNQLSDTSMNGKLKFLLVHIVGRWSLWATDDVSVGVLVDFEKSTRLLWKGFSGHFAGSQLPQGGSVG